MRLESLRQIERLQFPRLLGIQERGVEVHVFTYASERAMAAVAYVTWQRPVSASVNEEIHHVMMVRPAVQTIISRAVQISKWRVLIRTVQELHKDS